MPDAGAPVPVALAGLPGGGKTALASAGVLQAAGEWDAFRAAGYAVADGLAADHLRYGTWASPTP